MDATTPPDGWTPERRATCIELWEAGHHTADEITRIVGGNLGRNAIIGFIFRAREKGLVTRKRPKNTNGHQFRPPRPRPQHPADVLGIPRRTWHSRLERGRDPTQSYFSRKHLSQKPPSAPKPKPTVAPIDPWAEFNMPRHSIWELEDSSCRWPLGDEPPFHYCGLSLVQGSTWVCAHHYPMAYERLPGRDYR